MLSFDFQITVTCIFSFDICSVIRDIWFSDVLDFESDFAVIIATAKLVLFGRLDEQNGLIALTYKTRSLVS